MNHKRNLQSLEEHTADTLRRWDNVRSLRSNVTAELRNESNVIRLTVHDENENENESDLRLCHLMSLLPSTSDDKGTLQADYGLYTEGAGLLAVLHFNERDASVVPDMNRLKSCNVKLTMDFGNTQFSPLTACRVLSQDVVPIDRPHSLQDPYPVSIVGATRSAVTGVLAILASVYDLPVVSYGSTSSQLNSRDTYPYFGRTVPTNQGDAVATAQYFRQVLGVTHVGVLFVKDGYGSAFHQEFVDAAKNALDPPMMIYSVPYDPEEGEEGMAKALQQLFDTGYHYFYGIISTPTHDIVMRHAYKVGVAGHPGYTWILSGGSGQLLGSDFSYDASTEADLAATTHGIGVISLNIEQNPAFDAAWSMLERNQAIKDYFVDKHLKHNSPPLNLTEFKFYDTPTYWEYLQYDVVMALGFAACEAPQDFFTGPQLFDTMMNSLFRGASGLVEFDPKTGTRKTSSLSFKITNIVARQPDAQGKIYFDSFDTMRQDPTYNSKWMQIPDAQAYVYSDGTTHQPLALPPIEVNQHLISTGILVVGLFLGALCIVLSLACAGWVGLYRHTHVVRLAQPFFLLILCGGTFMMGLAVIPMSFQEPMPQAVLNAGCMGVPWLFSSGFVIAFSALLSKTLRISRLLHGGRSFRRVVVSTSDVLRPLVGLATLNVSILTAWNAVAPLRWTRVELNNYDEYGRSMESYGTCQSENRNLQRVFAWLLVGVDLIALLSANVVNFKARQISKDLHEGSYIALSLAILLEATLIGTPAMLVVEKNPSALLLIRSVLTCIFCGGILLPIFLPKWQAPSVHGKDSAMPTRSAMMPVNTSQSRRCTVAAIRSSALGTGNISSSSGGYGMRESAESLILSDPELQARQHVARKTSGLIITNRTSKLGNKDRGSRVGGVDPRTETQYPTSTINRTAGHSDADLATMRTGDNRAHEDSLIPFVAARSQLSNDAMNDSPLLDGKIIVKSDADSDQSVSVVSSEADMAETFLDDF